MSVAQYNDENTVSQTNIPNNDLIGRDWAITKFMTAVKGLVEVVEYESTMLESHGTPDYEEVNLRKTRGLRDLNQSMKDVARYMDSNVETEVANVLSDLQVKLHRNSELLQTHLEAVRELSQIVQMAARAEDTDGTYDPILVNAGRHK
ncbi:hypothetical protein [Bartonella bacilliformis]|uniref:Flagellar protein FlgN n=1 Tax=Bartonella bacilliformis Ver097 TaxID=1293911 RepID=A0A072RA41_BARBA|nr:hypothetical protein [Bartonella bacilliformis]KEG18339.1 hypothetical protein H710_01188 [Bartonella bacilliformis Ver097]